MATIREQIGLTGTLQGMQEPSDTPARQAKWYSVDVQGVIGAAFCLVGLATLVACFGRFTWLADVAGSFRLQYALVALLALAVYLYRKAKLQIAAALCVLIINGAALLPCYFGGDPLCEDKPIRLLSANVFTANSNHQALLDLIAEEDPDAILLMEVNQAWIDALAPLRERYSQVIERPRTDNFGIAFYTRLALDELDIIHLGEAEVPTVHAQVTASGRTWQIIGTHPVPPTSTEYWSWRNGQFAEIAALSREAQDAGEPVIVIGDLNAPPWSPHFRKLCDQAGLRNAGTGFGVQITWPTRGRLFAIPIDHCLVSEEFRVCDHRIAQAIGSDHYPVVVDLALP